MREGTTDEPTNFAHDGTALDRFIGRIHLILSIVRTVSRLVKSALVRPV
jgi:hypothetical protein